MRRYPCFHLAWYQLVCLCSVGHADAQAGDGLSYDADASCHSRSEFVSAVTSRGGRFDGNARRSLEVTISRADNAFVGRLRVHQVGRISDAREVSGATCAEVEEALSVVTAIALQSESTALSPTTSASALPSSPASTGSAPAPTAAAPDGIRTRGAFRSGQKSVTDGVLRVTRSVNIGAHAGATLGLLSSAAHPAGSCSAVSAVHS